MKKITDSDILNITIFEKGFVFAIRMKNESGKTIVRFFGYDDFKRNFSRIKKETFLKIKFGYQWEHICDQLDDYISCDTAFLDNGKVFVIFPNGNYTIFANTGNDILSSNLSCNDSGACDSVYYDESIWSVVPKENSVLRISPRDGHILAKIGGGEGTEFDFPTSLTLYNQKLYICNRYGKNILLCDPKDLSVKNYRVFNEKVFKYINIKGVEFVWLESGLWVI